MLLDQVNVGILTSLSTLFKYRRDSRREYIYIYIYIYITNDSTKVRRRKFKILESNGC